MSLYQLFLCLFLLFICTTPTSSTPCPFNPVCTCIKYYSDAYHILQAECDSPTLPSLAGPPGNYTVDLFFISSPQVYKIPASYFAAFSIDYLLLNINGTTTKQEFHPDAFKNTTINKIQFIGIDGLLPPPGPLRVLAGTLQELSIDQHGSAALDDSGFINFTTLRSLEISETPITRISQYAFAPISQHLTSLKLSQAGLTQFPTSALSYMSKLTTLSLNGNQIGSIPVGVLTLFPFLETLDLSGNPVANDVQNGNLNSISATVTSLGLSDIGLSSIPTDLLAHASQITKLSLQSNQISLIKNSDFKNSRKLQTLILDNNPLRVIEAGSFQLMDDLYLLTLTNTSLSYFDLALLDFTGSRLRPRVFLNNNAQLTTLEVSAAVDFPSDLYVSITKTALEVIKPECAALFQNRNLNMDISNNTNLQCKDLAWMAPFLFCTKQVKADGTLCADQKNTPLIDYLKSVVSNPCAAYSTTSAAATTALPQGPTTTSSSGRISTSFLMATVVGLGALLI